MFGIKQETFAVQGMILVITGGPKVRFGLRPKVKKTLAFGRSLSRKYKIKFKGCLSQHFLQKNESKLRSSISEPYLLKPLALTFGRKAKNLRPPRSKQNSKNL